VSSPNADDSCHYGIWLDAPALGVGCGRRSFCSYSCTGRRRLGVLHVSDSAGSTCRIRHMAPLAFRPRYKKVDTSMSNQSDTLRSQGGHAGLTSQEAARILAEVGVNELVRGSVRPAWQLLLAQFNSPVIWLLFGSSMVSAALGEVVDAIAIGTIVVINSLVGFFQEYRAEKAVLALRSMTAPRASPSSTPNAVSA
jgi:magnesium-transporting ATPase (P-type)